MFLSDPLAVTSSAAASTSTAPTTAVSGSTRVVLRFDGHVATAVLDDTPVAREFAALLPLTLDLSDPMGQAKSGRLPHAGSLDVAGAGPTFRTTVGELTYWAPSSTVAVFYEDLGQSLPDPGLVRLGRIDTGLGEIAAAGNRLTVRIEQGP